MSCGIVSRFLFLRDEANPFLRTVFQTKLGGFLPKFVVSTYLNDTLCFTGFMKEVADAFFLVSQRSFFSGLFGQWLAQEVVV